MTKNGARKKKPDLLALLAIIVGLGVIATSLAQGMLYTTAATPSQLASNSNPPSAPAERHQLPAGE